MPIPPPSNPLIDLMYQQSTEDVGDMISKEEFEILRKEQETRLLGTMMVQSIFLGLAISDTMRSMYLKIANIMSLIDSDLLKSWSLGCEHAWIIPFISKYMLSNSGKSVLSLITVLICGNRSLSHR